MKIISILLVIGLFAFVGYQLFGIVKDFKKRRELKSKVEDSEKKTD